MYFKVNFVYCHVMCTECIVSGNWNKDLVENPCKICTGRAGSHRQFSWSPFKYEQTEVGVQYQAQDPIRDFTYWVLRNFKREKKQKKRGQQQAVQANDTDAAVPENEREGAIETLVYSHYGGRYKLIKK